LPLALAVAGVLLLDCHPSAILGVIMAIILDAPKAQARHPTGLHIVPEKAKVESPFLARGDAAAAVVAKTRVPPVEATLQHRFSDIVDLSPFIVRILCARPVFGCPPIIPSLTQASAGERFIIDYSVPADGSQRSALTSTRMPNFTFLTESVIENGPAPECLA
jgi:hypothetical protein